MHTSSMLRMKYFIDNYLTPKGSLIKVLDTGSYDVNGSYKSLFDPSVFEYTGLDMVDGPNVDIVPKNTYQWKEIEDNSYDVVISGQAMEHAEFFWITASEMVRVLRPGGRLCIIVPRGFVRHRYPIDCYRFDADGMVGIARYCKITPLHSSSNLAPVGAPWKWYSNYDTDTMLIAEKPMDWKGMLDVSTYVFEQPDIDKLATGFVRRGLFLRLTYLNMLALYPFCIRTYSKIKSIFGKGR